MNTIACPCVSLGIWTLGCILATLKLRDSKCVGTIRTNFPKCVPFLHSAHMVFSHAFHARKLHTKQVMSHPKGRTERCQGHGHSPQSPVPWPHSSEWEHGLIACLFSWSRLCLLVCSLHLERKLKENAHCLVFLQAIHIRKIKSFALVRTCQHLSQWQT